jgi:hypothetical protein
VRVSEVRRQTRSLAFLKALVSKAIAALPACFRSIRGWINRREVILGSHQGQ